MNNELFLKIEKYLTYEQKLRFKSIDELQQEYEIWEQTNLQHDGEILKLRKELQQVQMENEILKKAVAIFSKEQKIK